MAAVLLEQRGTSDGEEASGRKILSGALGVELAREALGHEELGTLQARGGIGGPIGGGHGAPCETAHEEREWLAKRRNREMKGKEMEGAMRVPGGGCRQRR
ncbi:hypothetical protein TRIUR3_28393 [Triticum urartu]|uniref:Uncharacterized protein n=1 Tax=Triticum urartu TaxID=4572 RepID=M8AT46_TRIUA|nr:hypothetical protein TRIUR3_28393 [Triticum urartu]